uniref:Fibronectin type-III domain-containing protein n=1 Tax=Amphimedon queenslandica TaxID=400682 RepID=A0A1X7TFI8_AMPQE
MFLFISVCIITICGSATDGHSISKRDVPPLALHCTPQWNGTDQSFTVHIDFNVSNDIIGSLHHFWITFEVSLKSNGNTQSHIDVAQVNANSGTGHQNVTQFQYTDYNRRPISNHLKADYLVTMSWTQFPAGVSSNKRDTVFLYPPPPPTPVDSLLTNSVYTTYPIPSSFIVTITSLTVSWTIDDGDDNNQLIKYYLNFIGDFISQHAPSVVSNVTAGDNDTFTGQSIAPITIYVHGHSPFILIQMYSQYSVTGNSGQMITVTSDITSIANISLTTTTTATTTTTTTAATSTPTNNTPMSTTIEPTATTTAVAVSDTSVACVPLSVTSVPLLSVTMETLSVMSSHQVTESVTGSTTPNATTIEVTPTATSTSTQSTTTNTTITITTDSASGSNAAPIMAGAIGGIILLIIILIAITIAIKKQKSNNEVSKKADAVVTYDEIIVTPTTTTEVPIYDTPMELQANTAYDVINEDIINYRLFSSHFSYTNGYCYCCMYLAVLHYGQTVPDTGILPCSGDRVELTCTTDTGVVVWKADNGAETELTHLTQPVVIDSLNVSVTAVNGSMITATATNKSVNVSLNGTMIGCTDMVGASYIYSNITLSG